MPNLSDSECFLLPEQQRDALEKQLAIFYAFRDNKWSHSPFDITIIIDYIYNPTHWQSPRIWREFIINIRYMNEVTHLSHTETLSQTLSKVSTRFQTLLELIPQKDHDKLGAVDISFCQNTYIFENETVYQIDLDEPPRTLEGLLQESISKLLARGKGNSLQCQGQQSKDYVIKMKKFNFSRTIIETSPTFKTLFRVLPYNYFFHILTNYAMIVPYKGEHVQVTGCALNDKYNMKAIGGATRKVPRTDNSKEGVPGKPRSGTLGKKNYTYCSEQISRMQIFYCSHMNRSAGLFARNCFFDEGQKKARYLGQINHIVKNCITNHFLNKMQIPQAIQKSLQLIIKQLFQRIQDLFGKVEVKGKKTSKFTMLLTKNCPLLQQYHQLKERVTRFVEDRDNRDQDGTSLFNELYKTAVPYGKVTSLFRETLDRIIPNQLIGPSNKKILLEIMSDFISMKRYENFRMQQILWKMDVFELKWLQIGYNRKFHRKCITRRRRYLSLILALIFNEIVVQLIKHNFYVTEKHKEANRIFYYRKPVWNLIAKLAVQKFSEDNLEKTDKQHIQKLKKACNSHPDGKLRILPKKGTFRPIITFNRKVQFESQTLPIKKMKATLNQRLADTQLVLRGLKNILGQKLGYCIFDNRQISRKYDTFVENWKKMGSPPLKYFTLDIRKCYDSIDTSLLLKIIEYTPLIEDLYLIIKYNRLYRNKKALHKVNNFSSFFNFKERVTAIGISQDPMQIKEDSKVPSINIYPAKQKIITKETILKLLKQICEGSIVSYRKNHWLQKLGIPQGLNVSGVLCSLYFAYLEEQFVSVKQGLLMRLTDDYLYIGPEAEAVSVLDSLLKCSSKYGFKFSEQKISKNFDHPTLKIKNGGSQILWIGKIINIDSLQMFPSFELNQKVAYAMNVNLVRKNLKGFLKNKFKSLLTNHFSSYFKPKLFAIDNLIRMMRLYTQISLEKFSPFLTRVLKNVKNPKVLLIRVFKGTIHEFVLFACMLAQNRESLFYHQLFIQVQQQMSLFFKRRLSHHPIFVDLKKIFEDDCQKRRQNLPNLKMIQEQF